MGYLNESGLTRYDGLIKQWVTLKSGTVDGIDPLLNWQKTETAASVAFYPLPAAPIDPVINFLFTETGPASGTKGPDNPSIITGVSSVNVGRLGKNLLLKPDRTQTYTGYTISFNEDGSCGIDGSGSLFLSVTDGDAAAAGTPSAVVLDENKTYTLSIKLRSGSISGQAYLTIGIPSGNAVVINLPQTAGTTAKQSFSGSLIPDGRFHCRISSTENSSFSNAVFFVQLEEGSSETTFEEPMSINDVNYALPLGNTYYGGSIDLSTGLMTVTMQYMVADSNAEILWIGTNFVAWRYPAGLNCIGRAVGTEVCSHFPFDGAWDESFAHFYATPSSGLYLANPNWTASTYRQYFTDQYNNGTPVTACYQLADPITVQLSPTQIYSLSQPDPYIPRLNTVYSDQESVQVGYPKSPTYSEQELANAIISLGGNV